MSLSYHFAFEAPADTTAAELEAFLRALEFKARTVGFHPTTVLNVPFDTPERREWARRLAGYHRIEDPRLGNSVQLREGQVWHHDPVHGTATLIPTQGVVVVVTDERGQESCFGFLRYPALLVTPDGEPVLQLPGGEDWSFRHHIDSPDPRYRSLVREFARAGYLTSEHDEFVEPRG